MAAWLLFLSFLPALTGCAPADSHRPNILLIIVDTLRPDRLGCYGAVRRTSPEIDAFATGAVRFDRAYTTAPWTQPSVASVITGLYPSTHGVVRIGITLPDELPALPELLKAHGYATGAVVSHFLLGQQFGFHRGFEFFDESEALGEEHLSTPGVTRLATSLLDRFADQEKPFFLLVHYFDPHYTFKRHPEVGFAGPGAGRLRGGEPIAQLRQMLPDMTREETAFLLDLYDEEIRFTDSGIGRLINHLRSQGLYDKTVIVLLGDHGEEFLEHGWVGHTRTLYEELMWVPLIIKVPGGGKRGRVVGRPVSLVSLMPTLLDLAHASIPDLEIQSDSIAAFLDPERTGAEPEPIFFEVDFDPIFTRYIETKTAHKKAIVFSRFKLIRDDHSGKLELFDLVRDRSEETNLADRYPDIARALLPTLEARVAFARGETMPVSETVLSPDQIERLKRLGYLAPRDVEPGRKD